MGGRRQRKANRKPLEITLDHLGPKGVGGRDTDGRAWRVRAAPVGAVVSALPGRKGSARRLEIIAPAPDQVEPDCPVFGLCGGCQLQEMPLSAQRAHKQAWVERLLDHPSAPIRGADSAYGYRNKVELSFGTQRYLPEAEKDAPRDGHFFGFHPPGWFSRIVPLEGCAIATDRMNAVIAAIAADVPEPAWNSRDQTGSWRHVVIREGESLVVTLMTTPDADETAVRNVGVRVAAVDGVGGVLWVINDRLSDVAQGTLREVLHGDPTLTMEVCGVTLRMPHDAFFQINTAGTAILFETIGEALGGSEGGTLLDLYCGVGAIGVVLGRGYSEVVGIELNESAVECARENATHNQVSGRWFAGPVEAVLQSLEIEGARHVVVDPPRVGLHPKAAAFIAEMDAEVLVYVACNPAALARDREVLEAGGWSMVGLWTVDLFPQTLHVEAVARFERKNSDSEVVPAD